MVTQYGMSDTLGLPTYGDQRNNPFLGQSWGSGFGGRDYSEKAAKSIDEEVRKILQSNYERAKEIIKINRDRLVTLANALIDQETLDRDSFEILMNQT
jgi:cell division protease FtsH